VARKPFGWATGREAESWRTFLAADSIGLLIVLAFGVVIFFVLRRAARAGHDLSAGVDDAAGIAGIKFAASFRATPTAAPDNESGRGGRIADSIQCDEFLRQLESILPRGGLRIQRTPLTP